MIEKLKDYKMQKKNLSLNASTFANTPPRLSQFKRIRLASMDTARAQIHTPEFGSPRRNRITCTYDASPQEFSFFSENKTPRIRFSPQKKMKRSRLPPLLPSCHKHLRASVDFDASPEIKTIFKLRRFARKSNDQFSFMRSSYDEKDWS